MQLRSSSTAPAPARTAAAAAAKPAVGSVAGCQAIFTDDEADGANQLELDEGSALTGGIPACKGLTPAQINGIYDNAAADLPQAPSPSSAPASSPPSLAGQVVATFSGSGIENTPKFTVTDTWKLSYSFDCSNFGGQGNFQVYEDGGNDFSGVSVNDLAVSKSGSTYAYGDAGTHYLEINSECSWTVKVTDEG